jgi:hypothetical protein|tara:strand:- start:61 stop:180 length:120 start_codon:yes stop_codon:yes gene_type:complete
MIWDASQRYVEHLAHFTISFMFLTPYCDDLREARGLDDP